MSVSEKKSQAPCMVCSLGNMGPQWMGPFPGEGRLVKEWNAPPSWLVDL